MKLSIISSTESPAPQASGTLNHFAMLDILRGVAALAVVLYHFSDRLAMPWLVSHGYLAVDFFFIMSGFVLVEAYGERLESGRLVVSRFFEIRIVRLLPLVVLSTAFAYLLEIRRPGVLDPTLHGREALITFFLNALILPSPFTTTMHGMLFPLNNAMWSLFFEALANLVLPFWILARRRGRWLEILMLLSAAAMIKGAFDYGTIQLGFDWPTIGFGFPRITLSFGYGILLHRYRHRLPMVRAWIPMVALCSLLAMGQVGPFNPLFDCLSLIVLLPGVTILAIGVRNGPGLRRVSAVLGDLSYPVYAIHAPIVRIVTTLTTQYQLNFWSKFAVLIVSLVCIIGLAALVYAKFDVPVRRFLMRNVVRPAPSRPSA